MARWSVRARREGDRVGKMIDIQLLDARERRTRARTWDGVAFHDVGLSRGAPLHVAGRVRRQACSETSCVGPIFGIGAHEVLVGGGDVARESER